MQTRTAAKIPVFRLTFATATRRAATRRLSLRAASVLRMAQPRRVSSDRSDVIVTLRVTPQERDALRRAAQRAGVSTSDYLRGTALGGLSNRSTRPNTAGAASP